MSGHPRVRGARSFFWQEPQLGTTPIQFGTLPSFDGTPIFYCEEGRGKPLVFCYGIACSSLHWTYQIDYFRKNYRCIWFDYRGHRRSGIPKDYGALTVGALTQDLRAVLDFLGVENPVVLGHSMGVSIALEYARQYPVERLILANGTAKRPLDSLFGGNFLLPAFRWLNEFETKSPQVLRKLWSLQKHAGFMKNFIGAAGFNVHLTHPKDIETYVRHISELDPAVLTHLIQSYEAFDATSWIHQITVPTLVLSGAEDKVTPPETQELLAQLLPHAQLKRIEHGTHCTTLDLPEFVNVLIENFLNGQS